MMFSILKKMNQSDGLRVRKVWKDISNISGLTLPLRRRVKKGWVGSAAVIHRANSLVTPPLCTQFSWAELIQMLEGSFQ